jgi:hypothetical protein
MTTQRRYLLRGGEGLRAREAVRVQHTDGEHDPVVLLPRRPQLSSENDSNDSKTTV